MLRGRSGCRTAFLVCGSLVASGLSMLAAPPASATGSLVVVDDEYLDDDDPMMWEAGNTYYIPDDVTLGDTRELTIEAGVVVKLGVGVTFDVYGRLRTEVGEERTVFTSVNDDEVGEVVTGASSGVPAAGDWARLLIDEGSDVALDHVDVRYGGNGATACYDDDNEGETIVAMVEVRNAFDALLVHSDFRDALGELVFLDLSGEEFATVDSNTFSHAACGVTQDSGRGRFVANDFLSWEQDESTVRLSPALFARDMDDSAYYANVFDGDFVSLDESPLPARAIRYNGFGRRVTYPVQDPGDIPVMRFNWWGHVLDESPQACLADYYGAHLAPEIGAVADATCDDANPAWDAQRGDGTYFTTVLPALGAPLDPDQRGDWAARGRAWARAQYGDPVDTATGAFVDERADLVFAGDVPAMSWSRTYSSMDAVSPGLLGRGWKTPVEASVAPVPGAGDPDERDVVFQAASGERAVFENTAPGVWTRPDATYGTLVWDDVAERFSIEWDDESIWEFNGAGRLASVADWAGRAATLMWSGDRLASVVSSLGYELGFDYENVSFPDQVTAVTASLEGHPDVVVDYAYDGDGDLETVTREATVVEHLITDDGGLITGIEVPSAGSGLRTKATMAYDDEVTGRVTSQTGPNGALTTFTYYDASRVTEAYDEASGDVTTYLYNPAGQLVDIEDPLGSIVERSYNAQGNLSTVVDRRGNTTERTINGHGQLVYESRADGSYTEYDYDTLHRLDTVRVFEGEDEFETTYGYEGSERVPSSITGRPRTGPRSPTRTWSTGGS